MNWLTQIISIAWFNLRSLPQRKGATLSAMAGIAGVAVVLVGVLAIAEGFRKTLLSSVSPETAIVLRAGSSSEMSSGLTRDEVRLISDAPGIARGEAGPLASAELFVVINLPKRSTGTDANVPFRGVEPAAFEVRDNWKIIEGRRFELGKNEIIVGAGAARSFAGLEIGNELKIGLATWKIVGIFAAGGGAAESELWTDAAVLQPAYHRGSTFQSVYVKLDSPAAFTDFKDALTRNPQLTVKVERLADFFSEQSKAVALFITSFGVFIAVLMALGALFAALNTMYGSVAARTREIATLRALGFGTGPVVASVLAESVTLALAGGAVGALAAWLAFDGFQASTMNFQTFSQVTFAFAVTPGLIMLALMTAAGLGLLGGIFPAVRAARLPIAAALRDS